MRTNLILGCIYLVACSVTHLAWQWMTTEQMSQMSQLVWWMIKNGPVFCSLASTINLYNHHISVFYN